MLGSEPGSSIASWTLNKLFPKSTAGLKTTTRKVLRKVVAKKTAAKIVNKVIGATTWGRLAGRAVPGVGYVLLAKDVWDTWYPAAQGGIESYNNAFPIDKPAEFNKPSNLIYHICFEKGTLVYGKDSLIPIEKIHIGDSVYTYNFNLERVELNKVVRVLNRQTKNIYELTVPKEKIFVTAEHPFYVDGKGWVKVKELKPGDKLKTSTGDNLKVITLRLKSKYVEVHNIEVDGNHNYFVTAISILVHNKDIVESVNNITNNKMKKNE